MQHASHKLISATKYIFSVGNIAEDCFNGYKPLQDIVASKKKNYFNSPSHTHTHFHARMF
jgi:hypothetical protein